MVPIRRARQENWGKFGVTTTQVAKIRGPATAMQTGLLYESSLSGKPWVNLEQVVVDLQPGAVTPAGLKAAWTALAHRHQALRSVFVADAELGLQIETHPLPDFGFEVQSVAPLPSDLMQFLRQDRDRGADPLGFPYWRVTCLDRGAAGLTLVWTIHHALVDGTAMRIVLEDLHDLLAGQPLAPPQGPALANLDRQLCAQDKDAARAYFQTVLADPVGPTAWLTASDHTPGRIQRLTHTLPRATSDALRDKLALMRATPLNAVQAAWALVQARWGGQSRAVFGLVDSGRSLLPAYAQTVGCMISTLPMQVDLGAHPRLSDLLTHLRSSTLAMRPHGHADLADIRRWTGSPGNQPLFDSIVMLARGSLGTAVARAGKSGLFQDIRLLEEGSAPLTLAVYDDPAIGIEFEYDPARLPPDRAAQVLDHVARLLTSIANAAPDCALGQLAMLSKDEQAALIALAQPAHPVATDQPPCIATRFEAVAQATPDAIALISGQTGATLTYAALDQAANGMAQALVTAGLAPGDLVACTCRAALTM